MKNKKPELMAPAGDMTMLIAAVSAGADAVYFGIDQLNMRAKARNFQIEGLRELVSYCRENNVKAYLTLNTIIFEDEVSLLDDIIKEAKAAGVHMIICWDYSVIQKCRELNMPFAVSTQASVSNSVSANFYKSVGAARVVLARECTLSEIKKVRENSDIQIEAFVHGAMCIAVSGRCFMSHHLFGKSANRGECVQPCRREYEILDNQTGKSMMLGEDYLLSPKDLCSIGYIDQLIESGIDSFKIEGRKRSPEYVARTVAVYRKAIDLYFEGGLTEEIKESMTRELAEVYNRGFSSGFYFGAPEGDAYAGIHGSAATTKKEYTGYVKNYFRKAGVLHLKVETGCVVPGDLIYIIGDTTGVVEMTVGQLRPAAEAAGAEIFVSKAERGEEVTFVCETTVRPRDKVYIIRKV
jgi:putative protease